MGAKRDAAKQAREVVIRRLTKAERAALAAQAFYEGSPLHKRDPNSFGLTPPADPRPDKTLCDEAGVFDREVGLGLFARALQVGLASETMASGPFPKRLWALSTTGQVFEAIYGGSRRGAYHGYPVRSHEPLATRVSEAWSAALAEGDEP